MHPLSLSQDRKFGLPPSFENHLGRFIVIGSESKKSHYIMLTTPAPERKRITWVACSGEMQKNLCLKVFNAIKRGDVDSPESAKTFRDAAIQELLCSVQCILNIDDRACVQSTSDCVCA